MRMKLSNVEKYAIKGMLSEGQTTNQIAAALKKPEEAVRNYIDGELDKICNDIVQVKAHTKDPAENVPVLAEEEIQKTRRRLLDGGLIVTDVDKVINKALSLARKHGTLLNDSNALYVECIRNLKANAFMQKQTRKGNPVTIMTSAASQKLDSFTKDVRRGYSRSTKGNIYNPKTKEIN